MKICGMCDQEKEFLNFNRKGAGYQSRCVDCQKKSYKKYYDQSPNEKARLKERRIKIRKQNRIKIKKIKEDSPCTDCGNYYPYYVMDFDHQKDKKYQIANMTAQSWELIEKEINKCELVCANCHRIRTHIRANTVGSNSMNLYDFYNKA